MSHLENPPKQQFNACKQHLRPGQRVTACPQISLHCYYQLTLRNWQISCSDQIGAVILAHMNHGLVTFRKAQPAGLSSLRGSPGATHHFSYAPWPVGPHWRTHLSVWSPSGLHSHTPLVSGAVFCGCWITSSFKRNPTWTQITGS